MLNLVTFYRAVILGVFLTLTAPNGEPVYVHPLAIVMFGHMRAYCTPDKATTLVTTNNTICVRETPAEILKKLEEAS